MNFHNQVIRINNTATHTLTENITGGIIRASEGFSGNRADFALSGGTFEFYGSSEYLISQSNGCTLYNVNIDKSTKEGATSQTGKPVIDERSGMVMGPRSKSNTISLNSDFVVTNDLTITSGTLNSNAYNLYFGCNWANYFGVGGFDEGTGTVL